MSKILIIDDDKSLCYSLKRVLENQHEIQIAYNSLEAYKALNSASFDLVLLDYRLGKENGLEVLNSIKQMENDLPVVIMTAFGSSDVVIKSINQGARDYLIKPIELNDLETVIQRYSRQSFDMSAEGFSYTSDFEFVPNTFIGSSRPVNEILKTLARVAGTDTSVFITGESGTGKELVACLIHKHSSRCEKPFVAINCAAIPENLLESELFGYARGAFSGAYKTKIGKLESADGGTVFLDEIGDTHLNIQTKILRFLQEGVIERLGENVRKKLDLRIVSATNRDIAKLIDENCFRQDLLYRLNAVNIHLPPLRDRKEDLKDLLIYFVKLYSEKLKIKINLIDNAIVEVLEMYDWPGNIRELQNVISRGVMQSSSGRLKKENIKIEMEKQTFRSGNNEPDLYRYFSSRFPNNILEKSIELVEKELLQKTLYKNRFHLSKSAEELGISRVTLNAKIKKYRIDKQI